MVLPFHREDYRRVASEDEVMAALRQFGIPPSDYLVPCPHTLARARAGFRPT